VLAAEAIHCALDPFFGIFPGGIVAFPEHGLRSGAEPFLRKIEPRVPLIVTGWGDLVGEGEGMEDLPGRRGR
jgi:hypothetical protein